MAEPFENYFGSPKTVEAFINWVMWTNTYRKIEANNEN